MGFKKLKTGFTKIGLSLLVSTIALSSCKGNLGSADDDQVRANALINLTNPFGTPGTNNSNPNVPNVTSNNFQWGVASAGYQCEGYDTTSMWHAWDAAGKTTDRNPRGVDFYNKYAQDLDLAKNMGVNAFRLSIEWSRIEPQNGVIDPSGVAFYHNVINAIKARGMTPLVTLVHFNYPEWVAEAGNGSKKGLENPDFVKYYLRYVEFAVKEYGADVKQWLTFNEPNIWIPGAYLLGATPPGKKNPIALIRASWNLLKAHSKAYDLIHSLQPDAMVSANVFYIVAKPFGPPTPAPDSRNVALTMLDANKIDDTDWFFEALNTGKAAIDPKIFQDDNAVSSSTVSQPETLQDDVQSTDLRGNTLPTDIIHSSGDSQVGWLKKFDYVAFDYYHRFRTIHEVLNLTKLWEMEMYPSGLYDAIMYYNNKYQKPILIAENGMATENLKPRADKWTRESGLVQHIKYMEQARAAGANLIGYYYWSITDNYEWGSYTPRFGLYSVNALTDPSMKRIPTGAVDVYKNIISQNGVSDQMLAKYKGPLN